VRYPTPSTCPGWRIVVSGGQSNCVGGFLENDPADYGTGVRVDALAADNQSIQSPAHDPLPQATTVLYTPVNSGFPSTYVVNGKSFVLDFANGVAAQLPSDGSRVLVVQACVASVGFIGTVGGVSGWWSPGGQAEVNQQTRLAAAMRNTRGGGFNASCNVLVAEVWQEGESDAEQGQTAAGYKAALSIHAASTRALVESIVPGSAARAAFLVGGMVQDMGTQPLLSDYPAAGAVSAGAADVAGSAYGPPVPRSAYVSSANIPPLNVGNPHYSDAGYDQLALNYLAEFACV